VNLIVSSLLSAAVDYLERHGPEKANACLDRLVENGRLGSANAEAIKTAIPKGIVKLKELVKEKGPSK